MSQLTPVFHFVSLNDLFLRLVYESEIPLSSSIIYRQSFHSQDLFVYFLFKKKQNKTAKSE